MSTAFTVPAGAIATQPPEQRGLARDEVRLLVAGREALQHRTFRDLPDLLEPGDLVVVNTSATVPAALDATREDGSTQPVHVAHALDDGDWVVELRLPDGSGPDRSGRPGERLEVAGGLGLRLRAPYRGDRLWRAVPSRPATPLEHLAAHGRPVTYGHAPGRLPLAAYQTVFADEPGSAEMASAGRPFTAELVLRLLLRGIGVAPVVLHAGVSSPEAHEPPLPERFAVPAETAHRVSTARGRVVAVGTTVTRALESAADADGRVHAAGGWTDLVLGPDRPARVVTGLVSGLHEPEASHLLLLEAVAGRDLVARAYEQAVAERYLWHEFGDSTLFLP